MIIFKFMATTLSYNCAITSFLVGSTLAVQENKKISVILI